MSLSIWIYTFNFPFYIKPNYTIINNHLWLRFYFPLVEAVVEYDYDAVNPDELNLKEGEIITNINMLEEGWWEGELNGKRGMFPDNFVKVIYYFWE